MPDWSRHAERTVTRSETDGIERLARTPPARIVLLLVTGALAWPLATPAHEAFTRLRSAGLRPVALTLLVAGAAIAAHGVPSATAFAGGVAFYVAEAGAGIAFGLVATAVFIATWRRTPSGDVPVPAW